MAKNVLDKGYTSGVTDMPEDEYGGAGMTQTGARVTVGPSGAVVDFGGQDEVEPQTTEFDSNLADELNEHEQIALGMKLKELIEVDLESRASWERRMVDGLQIIGLEDIPDDSVAFEGAARVNYPGLAEAMVQFQARAMDELMPPEGPVKCGVIGKSSDELEAQAQRVEEYMNYQLMDEDDEYYSETESMLMYLPYAGSAFRKVAIDPVTERTRARFIPAADFIVPNWAKSLKTSPRYTHRYSMPLNTFKRAVANGYFIDADFDHINSSAATIPDDTTEKLKQASDKTQTSYHQDDVDLQLYEITIDHSFEWETYGKKLKYDLPYVITLEWETSRVVRIARCWKESDEKCTKDVWVTHYTFLPGLGFYGWGYLHIIGGLGMAASGAMRLLLDGSATASMQGGFKSREARMAGNVTFSPATWVDVDMSAEELSKAFYSPPFKEPSPALFKTLEILINGIQRFASTTEQMVGDTSANNAPVGTTLAMIEQGSKIFSGIHKRIHRAQGLEFKLIADCNFRFMAQDEYPFEVEGGDRQIFRQDFDERVDIKPISDPNIFSNVQRIATAQAATAMVAQRPDLFNKKAQIKAYRALITAMRLPDPDDYLPEVDSYRCDPVTENVLTMNGAAITVFPEQDDAAHMAVHGAFLQEVLGLDPDVQQKVVPILKAHLASHYANAYRKRMSAVLMQHVGMPLPPMEDQKDPSTYPKLPPEIENEIAQAVAQFAPPPPPAQPPQDPEAGKDMAASREADRQDMLAQRQADREDRTKMAQLQRDGIVNDAPTPPQNTELPPGQAVSPPAQ